MIRRLVLDVLKPHDPGLIDIATGLVDRVDVDGVTATVMEIDENVRTVRIVIEGEDLDLSQIEAIISDQGASIHSIDQVACGDRVIEDVAIGHR